MFRAVATLCFVVACASAPPSRRLPRADDAVVTPVPSAGFRADGRCPTISACEGHDETPIGTPTHGDEGAASSAETLAIAADAGTPTAPKEIVTTEHAPMPTPPAPIAPADVSYTLRQGVVVTESAAYVLGAEQGIDAIALGDGSVVWHSDDAALPLHVEGNRLIAMRGVPHNLILVSMDARDGSGLKACGVMQLPDATTASATDGLGHQFRIRARDDGRHLSVAWWASTQYVGGVPPTERMRAAAEHGEGGAMLIVPSKCRVVHKGSTRSPPKPVNYGLELPLTAGPFAINGWNLVVEIDETLVRIHHSRNAHTRPVIELPSPAALTLMSLDRRHVLIADAPGADGAFQTARLHRTDDGALVASIPFGPLSPEMFVVIGTRVMFATEDALHVHDHATPARSFVRPLRPIQYRGPYPPSAPSGPSQRPGNPRPHPAEADLL